MGTPLTSGMSIISHTSGLAAATAGQGDEPVLATFFLITYNQERYVRKALEGAFAQTYSPLEIVVSDDCSKDATFRIVEEMCAAYDGPHRIVLNRNPVNLGLIGHINAITSLCSGELIVYAPGDDISLPERTEKLVERYLATGRGASLIHSSVILIDDEGRREGVRIPPLLEHGLDLAEMALSSALIIGASSAFTRRIENTFGPISYDKCIEDLVMGFRSALAGGFECVEEPLLLYRHESGITARSDIRKQSLAQALKREIRNQEIFLAVLSQRLDDLRHIGNEELQTLVRAKRTEALLRWKVWTRGYRFFRMLSYSSRRGLLGVFLKTLFREMKWRTVFPLKKLLA